MVFAVIGAAGVAAEGIHAPGGAGVAGREHGVVVIDPQLHPGVFGPPIGQLAIGKADSVGRCAIILSRGCGQWVAREIPPHVAAIQATGKQPGADIAGNIVGNLTAGVLNALPGTHFIRSRIDTGCCGRGGGRTGARSIIGQFKVPSIAALWSRDRAGIAPDGIAAPVRIHARAGRQVPDICSAGDTKTRHLPGIPQVQRGLHRGAQADRIAAIVGQFLVGSGDRGVRAISRLRCGGIEDTQVAVDARQRAVVDVGGIDEVSGHTGNVRSPADARLPG
ncbi:MAG: hypothetical protein BWY63_02313 [Chloroflexi bacterium ADurb.Bin360]|nr:MAG: hypothetical protein BWY63_02313 [Chloroflexi bacterium ADurb.Bin360]